METLVFQNSICQVVKFCDKFLRIIVDLILKIAELHSGTTRRGISYFFK